MKKFAGIEVKDLTNTRSILTIQESRRAILQHLQVYINTMPYITASDVQAKHELENIINQQIGCIEHLDNYARLVRHLPRLSSTYIQYPYAPESLNALIDLAVKFAPYDWHIKGTLLSMDRLLKQIGESTDDEEFVQNFDYEVFKQLEINAKKLFQDATEKNLEIAYQRMDRVSELTNNVRFASNLPFVVGLQIYHYLSVLSYLYFYSGEDIQVELFDARVCNKLMHSVKTLEEIPEHISSHGCLTALTYLFYGKPKSDAKSNARVAPKLSLDI